MMAVHASPGTIADVAALLTSVGQTPRQINATMPFIGRGSVCSALLLLVRAGRATFDGEICRRRYRLAEGP